MDWLAPVVLRITNLGPWAPVVFVLIYIAAALTMAPAFFLTMAAGALFGVWQGSVVVFAGASLGASAVYAVASPLARSRWMARLTRNPRIAAVRAAIVIVARAAMATAARGAMVAIAVPAASVSVSTESTGEPRRRASTSATTSSPAFPSKR